MVQVPTDAFTGRRCVVTGGLGFIGSNLALRLAREGAEVSVIDAEHPRHGANLATSRRRKESASASFAATADRRRLGPMLSRSWSAGRFRRAHLPTFGTGASRS